jgi:hypothetical protein
MEAPYSGRLQPYSKILKMLKIEPGTNKLVYLEHLQITALKSYVSLAPRSTIYVV